MRQLYLNTAEKVGGKPGGMTLKPERRGEKQVCLSRPSSPEKERGMMMMMMEGRKKIGTVASGQCKEEACAVGALDVQL